MHIFKALVISIVITIFFIKILDLGIGYVYEKEISAEQSRLPGRFISLGEMPRNLTTKVDQLFFEETQPQGNLDRKVLVQTDTNGFIVGPGEVFKEKNVDIVFLGDSTTKNLRVSPSLRFPHSIGLKLSSLTNTSVSSLNGGNAGNNALTTLLLLQSKIAPIKPRAVIVMLGISDVGHYSRYKDYWDPAAETPIIQEVRKPRLFLRLLRDLKDILTPNTWLVFKDKFKSIFEKRQRTVKDSSGQSITDERFLEIKSRFGHDFGQMLRLIAETSKTFGIKPIFMTQPSLFLEKGVGFEERYNLSAINQLSYLQFKNLVGYANEVVREITKNEDILLIDLASRIPVDQRLYYDMMHFNDIGSESAATKIALELYQKEVFP